MKPLVSLSFPIINFSFFVFGMVGVWMVTHSWLAMFWAFVASIHVSFSVKK